VRGMLSGDRITVLAHSAARLAKLWAADGSIRGYDDAKYFAARSELVADVRAASALLSRLEHDQRSAIVRGQYRGDAIAQQVDPEFKPGAVRRIKAAFEDAPLHLVLIEVDEFRPQGADPVADPVACVDQFVNEKMPAEFRGISYHWQLSGSAGHAKNAGVLKAHVWFWLAQPVTSTSLKAWAARAALPIDASVFNTVQLHYTAAPNAEQGVSIPVPVRSGFVEGLFGDEVVIAIEPAGDDEPANLDERALMALQPTLGWTIAELRDYLADCDANASRDNWLHALMAAHHEFGGSADALEVVNAWSATAAKYAGRNDVEERWRSFGRNGSSTITGRWLLKWRGECLAGTRPDAGRVDMTDSGNANALFEETRGDLRYIVERKCWMWWDGCTWMVDESGAAARRAGLGVAERYLKLAKGKEAEAGNAAGEDRKRLLKLAESFRSWAAHCRNRNGLDNMLTMAARDERFAVSVERLDQDRLVLGVANGVVDLRTGELRAGSRDDLITKRSPFAYRPGAQCPRFRQFVDEITGEPAGGGQIMRRPALAAYAQRAIGHCATASVAEHKMFVAVGDGSNGKSVLLDMLSEVLGAYVALIPPEAMMSSSRDTDGERPTPFARNLAGARLAISSEARDGQKLSAAWIKRTTGDGRLTARGLHENPYSFATTHKLILLTNHQPPMDHLDEAARGRVHVWPFDMRWNRPGLPRRDPNLPDGDKALMDKLRAEGEGILAWIVEGAAAYLRDGLEPPAEVSAKTLDYFDQQDAFSQWLATMERCAAKAGTAAMALFNQFHQWAVGEGVSTPSPSTARAFANALQARGIDRERASAGTLWGLRCAAADLF
jgi:P4 family phage/plasmid primase-like protien